MSFVQAKCENCGGLLEVDSSLKAANCPHCGAAYVVQDVINNYNTVTTIENLHADVVYLSDDNSSDKRLEAADALLKLGKYYEAKIEYEKVVRIAPQKYRGWWGVLSSLTNDFCLRIRSKQQLSLCEEYAKSAITLAPEEKKDDLSSTWDKYYQDQTELNNSEIEEINKAIESYNSEILKNNEEIKNCDKIKTQITDESIPQLDGKIAKESNKHEFLSILFTVLLTLSVMPSAVLLFIRPYSLVLITIVLWAFFIFTSRKLYLNSKHLKELNAEKVHLLDIPVNRQKKLKLDNERLKAKIDSEKERMNEYN